MESGRNKNDGLEEKKVVPEELKKFKNEIAEVESYIKNMVEKIQYELSLIKADLHIENERKVRLQKKDEENDYLADILDRLEKNDLIEQNLGIEIKFFKRRKETLKITEWEKEKSYDIPTIKDGYELDISMVKFLTINVKIVAALLGDDNFLESIVLINKLPLLEIETQLKDIQGRVDELSSEGGKITTRLKQLNDILLDGSFSKLIDSRNNIISVAKKGKIDKVPKLYAQYKDLYDMEKDRFRRLTVQLEDLCKRYDENYLVTVGNINEIKEELRSLNTILDKLNAPVVGNDEYFITNEYQKKPNPSLKEPLQASKPRLQVPKLYLQTAHRRDTSVSLAKKKVEELPEKKRIMPDTARLRLKKVASPLSSPLASPLSSPRNDSVILPELIEKPLSPRSKRTIKPDLGHFKSPPSSPRQKNPNEKNINSEKNKPKK